MPNSSGIQPPPLPKGPDEMVSVQFESHPGEILIQLYPSTGTCPKGERLLVSIKDEIAAECQ